MGKGFERTCNIISLVSSAVTLGCLIGINKKNKDAAKAAANVEDDVIAEATCEECDE